MPRLKVRVGHDGRALLPFMALQGLSDEDLQAVVSYLRAQPPVRNLVPAHRYTLMGKVVKATALAKPVGPAATPPARSPRGASTENGRYLAESVALCWACHTQRIRPYGRGRSARHLPSLDDGAAAEERRRPAGREQREPLARR